MLFGPLILLIVAFIDISNTIIYFLSAFLLLLIIFQSILNFKMHNRFKKSFLLEILIVLVAIYAIVFRLT